MTTDLAASAHFLPAAPVFTVGAQPNAPRLLPPVPGISVDVIAFDQRSPQTSAEIETFSQPDAWPFAFIGGAQPYAPARISPQLTIPRVDAAPPSASAATRAEQIALNQAEAWITEFLGAAQPYAPRRALAGVPGFSIPPLSVDRRAAQTNAETVALSQADAWTYLYLGSSGPYVPAKLNAAITAARVDQPPPTSSRPIQLALAQISQADPWTYLFLGHQQPYTAARIAGSNFLAGPTPLDRRVFQTNSELAGLAQADPWTFVFLGGGQPYAPLRQSPGIPGLDRDPPPLDRRTLQNLYAQPSYQADPWTATFVGGLAPYLPKILNAQSVFVEIDNPPFEQNGPVAEIALMMTLAQPDPWTYAFVGGAQPYTPRTLTPSISAVEVDAPPNALAGGPYALTAESIALAQPDAWTYAFNGNAQPYGYGLLDPTLSAARADNPLGGQAMQWLTSFAAWTVQDFPVQPNYKLKITVRIGRSRAVVIT